MVDAPWDAGAAQELSAALLAGGTRVLQLRMKNAPAREMLAVARAILPLCRQAGALCIINDRLDVALAAQADGVHLGQNDLPLVVARRLAPAQFIIGVSTHCLAQALAAAAQGADYLGCGPVFSTSTKASPDPVIGLSGLGEVCRAVSLPVVAIGGITLANLAEVVRCGAAAAALIAALKQEPDIIAVARRITSAWN